ncbi:malate synthase G [Metabacillus fastidiosus]|uniref:malate synthase G n=1 Tax=Metabacillus fastidiosus TaxID=1458 RepID=UPI003D2AED1E
MTNYVKTGSLQVAEVLYNFVNTKVIPESGVTVEDYWANFEKLIDELAPENKALLEKRDELQKKIDDWHREHKGNFEFSEYKSFLESIGYLEPEVEDFKVTTSKVDEVITSQAGPQLVVPVDNARYALNAANARWGSLYNALYGTDAISEEDGAEQGKGYNEKRGAKVIEFAKNFLDQAVPLANGSHKDAVKYSVVDGKLAVELNNGETTGLKQAEKFVGFNGSEENPSAVLIKDNGSHFELQFDENHNIGKTDNAHMKDILIEAALTAIMDFEDSIAAVDAEDKTHVYSNLLGLIKGDLAASFKKGDKTVTRTLNPDRVYNTPEGGELTLSGRSLLFIRNVGHLMTSNAILDRNGNEVPEGIMDGMVSALIAKHDVLKHGKFQNSTTGSIYIVKPKMHGSEEVAFANKLFNRIEDYIGLERNTLKIGVMDEERRTSVNLKNCIHAVKERVVFINTGFLDRTGDEMHTSMEAGVFVRKGDMKSQTWLQAYEKNNVKNGLLTGLQNHAQIGKGMWAMPDLMKAMLEQKGAQLQAGANTAWVPSPTAAALHALHYHQTNVIDVQNALKSDTKDYRDEILQIPLAENPQWTAEEIKQELDNNCQGILGYVVRWVELGRGASKVPDINNIGLMEDRATLRISSQLLANWLHHGVCTEEQVMDSLKRMAKVVDDQNSDDPKYRPMAPNFDESNGFRAACELIFKGTEQPSGYTEPLLHSIRAEEKAKVAAARA